MVGVVVVFVLRAWFAVLVWLLGLCLVAGGVSGVFAVR